MNIFVEDGVKLGLMVRGGSEYGLGIYIAGIDPGGAAEYAGLKVSYYACTWKYSLFHHFVNTQNTKRQVLLSK